MMAKRTRRRVETKPRSRIECKCGNVITTNHFPVTCQTKKCGKVWKVADLAVEWLIEPNGTLSRIVIIREDQRRIFIGHAAPEKAKQRLKELTKKYGKHGEDLPVGSWDAGWQEVRHSRKRKSAIRPAASPDRDKQIYKMRQEGKSFKEIGEIFKLSPAGVRNAALRAGDGQLPDVSRKGVGGGPKKSQVSNPEKDKKAAQLRKKGKTFKEIAEVLGFAASASARAAALRGGV